MCHQGVLPVISSLNNHEVIQRVNKVLSRTVIFQYSLYILIAISGFLTAPVTAPELIVLRENYVFKSDTFMIIAQFAFMCVLLMVISIKFSALRSAVLSTFTGSTECDFKRNIITTIIVLLFTTSVGFVYDVISNYLSVIGGFCSVTLGFLIPGNLYSSPLPGILYVKSNEYTKYHWKNITTLSIVITLTIIGFISGFRTLISIIYK